MDDRIAASAGFVISGVAVATLLLRSGSAALAAIAGVAFVGFALRRYGYLRAPTGAALAGAAGVGLVGGGVAGAVLAPATDPATAAVAVVAGAATVVAALLDWRDLSDDRLAEQAAAAGRATVVGIASLAAIVLWSAILTAAFGAVDGGSVPPTGVVIGTLAGGLGTVTVAAAYLHVERRGVGFLDVRWPTRRDVAYAIGGVLALVGVSLGLSTLFRLAGTEAARHGTVTAAESTPAVLLLLIPLSYLVIGPGEELLFRNVIQKSLYDTFSRRGAVVVASVVFAIAHVFSFASADPVRFGGTLAAVFVLSLVLGVTYERTGNVLVPVVIHGTNDALAFGESYLEFTGTHDPLALLRVAALAGVG